MLTIFSVPKPFKGHINVTQRNAIQSWLKIRPKCEVILFGSEYGVKETAVEFGIKYVPDVEQNEFGNFIIPAVLNKAAQMSNFENLVYTSCDIIFLSDFPASIASIKKPLFLAVGSRWDSDITEPIDFNDDGWEDKIREFALRNGKFHGYSAVDYPTFPKQLLSSFQIPKFAVGRPVADNWLIYKCLKSRIPVIDVTKKVFAIHQNHDYNHHPEGKKGVMWGEEAKRNLNLAGGFSHCANLRNADWVLTEEGLARAEFKKRIFNVLALSYPGRSALSLQRIVRNFLAEK
jgi:hypothetical protein